MTRFMEELTGKRGDFWKRDAEKELAKRKAELENGEITIDENGIAYNRISRVVVEEWVEQLSLITDKIDAEATTAAREEAVARELAEYRKQKRGFTEEELAEMRATFGAGTTVRDIITGEEIIL